ncbi:MAG: bi-domain-containing oxidoreductase [Planctomycetota bacterium]|nr:bi-domain-containing oxidoreductase [Planctomycetota bacterium]
MQQVVQNVRNGKLSVKSVPDPIVRKGQVLIANRASLISAGTEKLIMDLAAKSLLGKAKERPDHVKRVMQKIKNEGLVNTLNAVFAKLDEPMPMGYSSAGVVLACGEGVQMFKPGDMVASNGGHAGVVSVPKHLCAKIPENVLFEQAAFTVVGSIAMQGVRLARVQLGETVFVIGLGLIGQITAMLLKASGCRVIGTDLDKNKCNMAVEHGWCDIARPGFSANAVEELTAGHGADSVMITASTKSDQPVLLASHAVRQKGRIVAVGAVGLSLDRRPLYFKEAEFVVSCSYGPGRYDAQYEDRGNDYPLPDVRWTEQRNMQAFLDLLGTGKLDLSPLISHRFSIENSEQAYEMIESSSEPYLGIIINYPSNGDRKVEPSVRLAPSIRNGKLNYGCVGSGNFARSVLIPAINSSGCFNGEVVCSAGGLSAVHAGEKSGFSRACTNAEDVFDDGEVDAVFIATQHGEHAKQVISALELGKHVFVEKPLALTLLEIDDIEQTLQASGRMLMVGFNRRFAPLSQKAKEFFSDVKVPLTVSFRFNAGEIPSEHWTQDDESGGGRIIGEACHAIDTATYLTGSPPVRVYAESVGGENAPDITDDQSFITIRHENGSISNIAYLAGGDKAFPKERIEVIGGGRIAVIDDFRTLTTCANGKIRTQKCGGQDKGHKAEVRAFGKALRQGGRAPISWAELKAVSRASILAVQSIRQGIPKQI